jgi:hypothetical protein
MLVDGIVRSCILDFLYWLGFDDVGTATFPNF